MRLSIFAVAGLLGASVALVSPPCEATEASWGRPPSLRSSPSADGGRAGSPVAPMQSPMRDPLHGLVPEPATPSPLPNRSALLATLPGTFVGMLPCADCPGIRYQVEIFPDGVFYLRTLYMDRGPDASADDIGRWSLSSSGRILVLEGGREASISFRLLDVDRIEKLDHDGRPIVSTLNYTLRRTEEATPLEPRLSLRGMYRYFADTWLFRECRTGRTFPVVGEATLELERAFMAGRGGQEWLLMSVDARIRELPPMEGPGTRPHIEVHRLLGVWPGEECGAGPAPTLGLVGPYWRLTRLRGEAVVQPFEAGREPHLVLELESDPDPIPGSSRGGATALRVAGSGGCNRLVGSARVEGDAIRFGPLAGTRMLCPDAMEIESRLESVLAAAERFDLRGRYLELYDYGGVLLARFEARQRP